MDKLALPEHAPQTPREVAIYIGDMTGHLARMARNAGLDALAYVLEMAMMEAQAEAGKHVGDLDE
jgi:hypothetical protein